MFANKPCSRDAQSRVLRNEARSSPETIDLRELRISDCIIDLVPESVARENTVLPVDFDGETLTCATDSDTDIMLQDKLRFMLNCNVKFLWCDRGDILSAINQYYGVIAGESADSMMQEFADTAIDFTETALEDESLVVECLHDSGPVDAKVLRQRFQRENSSRRKRSFQSQSSKREGIMFYTVPEGKRVLAHRRNGRIDQLVGPCRVWKFGAHFESMRHYVAHPGQYLAIRFRDGREQMEIGPTEIWQDPREHHSIEVKDCVDLAAKEVVVVYNADNVDAEASRRIFSGPGLFVPQPGEWLHRFSWHASNGGSRGEEKRPNGLKFEKLCLMPDQMYHDVRDVRTADDAVLTIRLMIFFELVDIDRMLDTTRDPIGDFINAATSDVVEFIGKRSFEQFKLETDSLNETDTYAQLMHRASQCGYRINNVVYRGYGAPDSLQSMHDEAIQTRTRLRLERATEEQAQDVEDYRLKCQMERSLRRRTEQIAEVQHDLETKRQQAVAGLEQREAQEAFDREQRRATAELELELAARNDEQLQSHLERLRGMQVDLTEFLTQARADQVIEVRGQATLKPELRIAEPKR